MNATQKMNVKIKGKGDTTMILVHGYGCDQKMWRFLTPLLEKTFRLVLIDLIGAGQSDTSLYDLKKYSQLSGYADDILELCNEMNLTQAIFVGHSVSAMIGILAAQKNPQCFKNLVLIGPSPCYFNDGNYKGGFERSALEQMLENANQDFLGWARAMGPAIMGNPERPELGVELTNSFCSTNPEIAKHFSKTVFLSDNRKDIAGCQTPSLILQCSQDIVAPEEVGQYVYEHLKKSTFVKLEATGHCPHVSAPEETAAAIIRYLG